MCVCVSMCVSIYTLGLHLCVYLYVSVCTGVCAYACVCMHATPECVHICVCKCVYCVCVCAGSGCAHLFVWQHVSWTCVCVHMDIHALGTHWGSGHQEALHSVLCPHLPCPLSLLSQLQDLVPKPPTPQHLQPRLSPPPDIHQDSQPPFLGPLQPQTHIASRIIQSKPSLLLYTWITDLQYLLARS